MPAQIHLVAHAPVASRVLLPGDPGRALRLAQVLIDSPRMLNHNRGLWGYTGAAADGELLTIQSTGMGAPSAAIVVEELAELGAERVLRIGTCGALVAGMALGDLVDVDRVIGCDGVSRALGHTGPLVPSLRASGDHVGACVTTDLFYADPPAQSGDAIAIEMEAAAVLAVAAHRGLEAGVLLLVSDLLAGPARERIEVDALHAAEVRLGRAGAAALGV